MKAIVFGEIIWDIYPEEETIGGAQLNFAAHLAHLGNEAYLISAVGDDPLGKRALAETRRHGIKTDLIQTNGYRTGACIVSLDANRIPCYDVIRNTAYDNVTADRSTIEAIKALHPDMLSFNTLIQRSETSRNSLTKILEECDFPEIFCDINLRKDCFDIHTLSRCLSYATILKISDEEAHFLYDLGLIDNKDIALPYAVAEKYPQVKIVIYTLGKNGSQALDVRTGKLYESGLPPKVQVVSTVGAGDCYGATFTSVIMNGGSIPDAIKFATERSSIVVANREAVPF